MRIFFYPTNDDWEDIGKNITAGYDGQGIDVVYNGVILTQEATEGRGSISIEAIAEKPVWESAPPSLAAWIVGIAAFAIYYMTSAPTISWLHNAEDGGELTACAATLGISHPTGYPLYTLLGWVLIHLSHPMDPGRVMVLFSVVCGALGIGILARTCTLAIHLLGAQKGMTIRGEQWWGALAASYAAVNPLLWSQAVVVEVYSLAILLQALIWLHALKYLEAQRVGDSRRAGIAVLGAGMVFGLVMAHHVMGASVLFPLLVVFIVRPTRKPLLDVGRFLLGMIPGLLFYAYLPIRASQNPAIDWGHPDNLHNFFQHVSAAQYRGYMFDVTWTDFVRRLTTFPWDKYWGIGGVILLLIGLGVLGFSGAEEARKGTVARNFGVSVVLAIIRERVSGERL